MKKNTVSQRIGAQMVDATTGAAFTGSVTVYVTLDAGTQAIGSVGSGACTHEGNGYHTYAPAQAETNGDLVAFTFVGTGAVPATVQVYTSFPQTGDTFDRLGAPAGASVSADVAAVKTQTAAIEVDTQDIQSRLPAALVSGRMDASVGAMASNVMTAAALATDAVTEIQSGLATSAALTTVAGYLDTEIAAILADTNELQADWANGGRLDLILDSRASQASVDTIDTVVDAILVDTAEIGAAGAGLTALATQASVNTIDDFLDTEIAAIKTKTDLIPTSPAAVSDIPTAVQNADALLGRNVSGGSSTGRTVKQAFHFIRNRWVVAAGTLTVYDTDDSTSSWTAAVTGTAGADPVTGTDPA